MSFEVRSFYEFLGGVATLCRQKGQKRSSSGIFCVCPFLYITEDIFIKLMVVKYDHLF